MRYGVWICALLLALGCTEANPHAKGGGKDSGGGGKDSGGFPGDSGGTQKDGAPPKGDASISGGTIKIYVKGDRSKPTVKDGLSGQTPRNYEIALSAYEVLTSANDKSPTLCFDHGKKPVVTKMTGDTLVGYCETRKFKSGNYTHGRTRVDWARFTVDGVYHIAGQKVPTVFTFFRAYSDTTYKNIPYKAGSGFISGKNITTFTIPMVYGPLPPMPGVSFETKGGKFYMTFAYPKPLPIVPAHPDNHWARFHWKVGEAFRWKELKHHNYKDKKWDVNVIPSRTEQVLRHGVLGYNVTSSVDK